MTYFEYQARQHQTTPEGFGSWDLLDWEPPSPAIEVLEEHFDTLGDLRRHVASITGSYPMLRPATK
ncbi:MAG TPA: hypothetical protein VGG49_02450 [Steroidobacteraceae bacterium]